MTNIMDNQMYKKWKMLNNKGFSLMESMVVIIIIGICIAIWGYHGRDHIKIAMMSEAEMFVDKIIAQEKIYRANNGVFIATPPGESYTTFDPLFINTKSNKYFKTFKITIPPGTMGTVIVEIYPDIAEYPDMNGYYIRGIYASYKDTIEYHEFYG